MPLKSIRAASRDNVIIAVGLLLLMLAHLPPEATAFCPSKCDCGEEYAFRVKCTNAGLEVVPIQLNPEVKVLELAANQIGNVDYTLTFYNQLQALNLTGNKIDNLGANNFEYQVSLLVLDLSRNSIRTLSKDAFRGLRALKRLLLNDNYLQTIHHHALADLHDLRLLQLNNNQMTSLAPNTLQHVPRLVTLTFENNQLLDVPRDGNFLYLKQLAFLNLRRNLIEEIRNNSFSGLEALVGLNLAENVLNRVEADAFVGLTALKWLNLADNNLTSLPTNELSILTNLTYLSLCGNTFDQLPPVALMNLFNLRELRLSRLPNLVRIDPRTFADNRRLVKLAIANNTNLESIPSRVFHGLDSIRDLSLRGNSFTTMDAAQIPIDRLARLQMGDNPLVCNCSLLWLWRLIKEERPQPQANGFDNDDHDDLPDGIWRGETEAWSWNNAVLQSSTVASLTIVDRNGIGCEVAAPRTAGKVRRHSLATLKQPDIECPAEMLTIICAIFSIFLVLLMATGALIYYLKYSRKNQQQKHRTATAHLDEEQRHKTKKTVAGECGGAVVVNKMDFERYIAVEKQPPLPSPPQASPPPITSGQQQTLLQQQQHMYQPMHFNNLPLAQHHHQHQQKYPIQNEYHEPILRPPAELSAPPLPPRPTLTMGRRCFYESDQKSRRTADFHTVATRSQFEGEQRRPHYNYTLQMPQFCADRQHFLPQNGGTSCSDTLRDDDNYSP